MKPNHYRIEVTLEGDEATFLPSGEYMQASNQLFQPGAEELRRMLEEIRKELGLSISMLGAVLGAPRVTLRKWFSGERNPTGASRRLIWLVHARLFHPETLEEPGAWLKLTRSSLAGSSSGKGSTASARKP